MDKFLLKKCIIEIFGGFSDNHNEDLPLCIPEHCYDTLADTIIERFDEENKDAIIDAYVAGRSQFDKIPSMVMKYAEDYYETKFGESKSNTIL